MRNDWRCFGRIAPPSLFFFLGGICLLPVFLPLHLTLLFLLSAVLHECGHIAAMMLLGIPIRGFRVSGGGAVLRGDMQGVSYRDEFLAALAGPAVNILLSVLFSHISWAYSRETVLLNLLLACYNLLPIGGNDGAVMLYAAAQQLGYGERMQRGLSRISGFCFAVLLMMGAWIMWYGALSDPGGNAVGYGAMFFCVLVRFRKLRCR